MLPLPVTDHHIVSFIDSIQRDLSLSPPSQKKILHMVSVYPRGSAVSEHPTDVVRVAGSNALVLTVHPIRSAVHLGGREAPCGPPPCRPVRRSQSAARGPNLAERIRWRAARVAATAPRTADGCRRLPPRVAPAAARAAAATAGAAAAAGAVTRGSVTSYTVIF